MEYLEGETLAERLADSARSEDRALQDVPNPTVMKNWAMLPDGRTWGSTAGVDIGPDGNVWAYDRCGANACAESTADPILKFDRMSGRLLASFGSGMFIFPHGLHVDRDGNVWVTDGQGNTARTKGHQRSISQPMAACFSTRC
jgi:hypothetical protein